MGPDPDKAQVKAAGGVVWRRVPSGVELALVHRPKYDDWSLPKGKLDKGEEWDDAALREVEEEVGAVCELGAELEPIAYRDNKGRDKVVRYWLMEATDVGPSTDFDEIDEVRWVKPGDAFPLLTYERDQGVVAEALDVLGE